MLERIKSLINEVAKLRKLYPDEIDGREFDSWQKDLEDLGEAQSIKENSIIKEMIHKAEVFISANEAKLTTLTSDKLPNDVRDGLIAQVEAMKDFLNNFANVEEQVKDVEKRISEALEHYKKSYPHEDND